jgi:hypothetical protein
MMPKYGSLQREKQNPSNEYDIFEKYRGKNMREWI